MSYMSGLLRRRYDTVVITVNIYGQFASVVVSRIDTTVVLCDAVN